MTDSETFVFTDEISLSFREKHRKHDFHVLLLFYEFDDI